MKTYLPSEIYRQVSLVPGISCLVPKVAIFIAGSEQRLPYLVHRVLNICLFLGWCCIERNDLYGAAQLRLPKHIGRQ
jgi:hypothetical protein